ncbi:DUF5050 domain-containing protein [Heliobacterium undosum]|uniref:DUF5050 domain-containing protein n=1 Tax=Heliomicrobium undosum TaxID=121734 RepID=A0A845L8R6_9FIRM|nr:DUF5050 domain-containing protein [Heliomicrobium undosum]MZP31415.1 DUF5050 domain-containing protein [Heliomicrobium undosum]
MHVITRFALVGLLLLTVFFSTGLTVYANNVEEKTDQQWYYFLSHRNSKDPYKIYKVKSDGSELQPVTDDMAYKIQVIDDWIYYMKISEIETWARGIQKGELYKIKNDGTSKYKFDLGKDKHGVEKAIYDFFVSDNSIYCAISNTHEIYKIDTDDKNRAKITEDKTFRLLVKGDTLYYFKQPEAYWKNNKWEWDYSNIGIYSMKTDGSSKRKIADMRDVDDIVIKGEKLIVYDGYNEYGNDPVQSIEFQYTNELRGSTQVIDLKSMKKEKHPQHLLYIIDSIGEWTYCIDEASKNVYKVNDKTLSKSIVKSLPNDIIGVLSLLRTNNHVSIVYRNQNEGINVVRINLQESTEKENLSKLVVSKKTIEIPFYALEPAKITLTAIYEDGTKKDITEEAVWNSKDSDVAIVSKGKVYSGILGETIIIATYNGISESMRVVVCN